MRTRQRSPARPATSSSGRGGLPGQAPSLVLIAAVGLLVAAFFLGIYLPKDDPMPIGWDTPRYLGQTQFVAERGLAGVPDELPPPIKTLESRAAGFPVLALTISSFLGTNTVAAATVLPVAGAVALALASGAFVSFALRRPPWEMAVVSLVVGVSPAVIRLMSPETYTDNLVSAALILAALLPILTFLREGRGFIPAILLLAAAGLAHPSILGIFLVVLAAAALSYLPASWRARRQGGTVLSRTPAVRLALVGVVSGAITAAALLAILHAAPDTPTLTRNELTKKFRQDIPLYALPLTIPLGAMGIGSLVARLARRRSDESANASPGERRDGSGPDISFVSEPAASAPGFTLRLFLAWTGLVAVGVLAFLAGQNSPAHRFLAFFLPLPILAGLGILWAGRLATRRGWRVVGAAVVLIGVAALAVIGFQRYYVTLPETRGIEWMELRKAEDAVTAAAYLDALEVPAAEPVVFVVDDRGFNPLSYVPEMAYILRSMLPPERIETAYFYVGDPDRYLAGLRTWRSDPPTYNTNVNRFWPAIRRLLPERPIALMLETYNPAFGQFAERHPDRVAGPGLVVLEGPLPDDPIVRPAVPTGPRSITRGALLGIGTLGILGILGLGWALAVGPRALRPFETIAVSLAFGLGLLVLGGTVVDTLGIRLAGFGGVLAVALVGISGWLLAARRFRIGRSAGGTAPS